MSYDDLVGRLTETAIDDLTISEYRRKLILSAVAAIQELQRDAMRLDWLQEQYTLHKEAEIWYVVDGYQINLTEQDGSVCRLSASGETLRQAIDEAMQRESPAP